MATGVDRLNESAVRAATPQTSTARVSVTRPAGPRPSEPWWARPRASAPFTNIPQATPVAHPAPPRPTAMASRPSSASTLTNPTTGPA